jgi:hypothetical protein
MGTNFGASWRSGSDRLQTALRGAITILAFSESGRMRRLRLPKRLLVVSGLILLTLVVTSTASILSLFRGQVDLARVAFLERENRSLASLLEGQAEQVSRLKVEVARLKELEQSLRVVSGMGAQEQPLVGTGPARVVRPERPVKR